MIGKKNEKGFTLIELLAVIVILGLLMAIAIPSVTKYITQSRKKTLATTIGNYIGAITNQVNDMEYTFTGNDTIYAVPIECIAVERGGTNPFGKWYPVDNGYWAYVLVQYDDTTSSYTYGFTFKDSAGYSLYPTTIAPVGNWDGFDVTVDTKLFVLEGREEGDGIDTCTILQKDGFDEKAKDFADNYEKLNYIESTGNEWIDTGVNGGEKMAFKMKANTLGGTAISYEQYFAGDITPKGIKLYAESNQGFVVSQSSLGFDEANQETDGTIYLYRLGDGNDHIIEFTTDGTIVVDGEIKDENTPNDGWGELTYYLFSSHSEGGSASMKLYELKMWKNDQLVRDFVPCKRKSDEMIGLYDNVNGIFYENVGSGEFLGG